MLEGRISPRVEIIEPSDALRAELAGALTRLGFEVDARSQASLPADPDERARPVLRIVDLAAAGAADWLAEPGLAARCLFLAGGSVDARRLAQRPGIALDILDKPFSIQQLEARLRRRLEALCGPEHLRIDPLLQTRDPRLARLFERALEMARRACPISLEGELGTGRRALARAIHAASARATGRFVVVDGPDVAPRAGESLEQALQQRVANAIEGTLVVVDPEMLDDRAQRALERALRAPADDLGPRCISISRIPLDESVRAGRLSAELLYRLSGARFRLPPLRERSADRHAICAALARRVARELGLATPRLESELVDRLAREGFPGNRLGLESRLRGALLRAEPSQTLETLIFAPAESPPRSVETPPSFDLKTLERETIVRALDHASGNRTHASAALGISVRTLRNKIREYGLR